MANLTAEYKQYRFDLEVGSPGCNFANHDISGQNNT